MKKIVFSFLFVSLLLLSACTNQQNPDVSFGSNYKDDSAAQEEKINELKTPPGEDSSENNTNPEDMSETTFKKLTKEEQLAAPEAGETIATIETNMGTIKLKFFEEQAPELTKNFIELAKSEYYDELVFHRVIKGFMIQGGDPLGNGTGGHSYKGEGNGLGDEEGALSLSHYPGAVACAKSSLPNSIGSQFYIVHGDAMFLNGNYSVFGQVYEGLEIIDKIAEVKTDANDKPGEDVIMEKVTIGVAK